MLDSIECGVHHHYQNLQGDDGVGDDDSDDVDVIVRTYGMMP